MSRNDFKIGSQIRVDVTEISDPHSFYVRPRAYNKYLPILHTTGARPDIMDINAGEIFTFKSIRMNSIVRGRIISCEKMRGDVTCIMLAIDFGYIEQDVTRDRIWNTNYALHVEPLVIHCKLDGCAPAGASWDPAIIKTMKSIVAGIKCKIVIQRRKCDRVAVRLFNKLHGDIGQALAAKHPNSIKIIPFEESEIDDVEEPKQYLPTREVQVGELITVRMQSGSLYRRFFVVPIENDESFNANRDKYTEYANMQKPLKMQDLSVNSPVGVFYYMNLRYERGLVQALLPQFNRARVFMVDIGIIIESSVLRMKKVPDWHLSVPIRAMLCTLHASQIFSNLITTLSEPGVEFEIYIKSVADEGANCAHVVRITALDDN